MSIRRTHSPPTIFEYNNEMIDYNNQANINYYKKFEFSKSLSIQRNCIIFFAITNTILISYILKLIFILYT